MRLSGNDKTIKGLNPVIRHKRLQWHCIETGKSRHYTENVIALICVISATIGSPASRPIEAAIWGARVFVENLLTDTFHVCHSK